ncbi:unnamed protein product [Brassicogethes aeneus]|uniref:PHD finger protein rhinoceros n=1 Tax=Brassicogethes aeneus TaxID=1431903 RepID=A0A9P0ARG6_BRAAE|nr:unnamed protein product [Brassicogethes aeneus]
MSQRVKRPNRSEDGSVPVKRRKRTAAEEEEAATLAAGAWQPRSNDLKSIYNRTTTEAPAELFRKDLISAMKLPDSEPLASDEYWVIVDQWKQEWERGVQVPVNPDSLPEPSVTVNHCNSVKVKQDFKLPKNKYIRITKDDNFKPEEHEFSTAPAQAEAACAYDLDECDVAWLKILNSERASAGLGSVYDDQLERVMERFEECCWDKIQSILRDEEGLGIEFDENVICDVCRSPDSEEGNEMVFCDNCNICVHQACYGITRIPEGQWLCCTCNLRKRPECVLCPNKGGAMKCTRSGQKWAHVSCALWIPEVSIGCVEKMEPITKISSIPSSRWALICVLCRERVGACIQCSVKTCKTAYHVTCAFKHGLEMRAIIEDENADDGVKLRSYCEKHSKSSKKEKSICSGSEDDDCKRKKRKDMTSEEKNQARAARLQEIEAEFYKHVSVKDVVGIHLDVDNEALQYIYNYWKLKRKAGHNKPLLPPKSEDVDMISHKREQADLEKMKMFVQLRQDLERVRNLCYMVSRREKLSRTFFRMREQTFHKQAEVLESSNTLPSTVIQAVIEANHGPSIYDRLYSHDCEDHTSDFDTILARIAGIKSPTHSGDEKKYEVNGLFKDVKNNPYKKIYFNGSSKRGSGSLYGSGMSSSNSSSDERKDKENRLQSSSEDEKPSVSASLPVRKKSISPAKKSPSKTVDRKKKPVRSKPKVDSSSGDDVKPTKKDWGPLSKSRLSQMDRELGDSGTESDDLLFSSKKKNDRMIPSIYSDSDSSSNKNDDKSSNATNDSQSKVRTKAAVKDFTHKPSSSKSPNKSSPENKKKSKIEESKKKDYVPSDLIVPQRQAAKKATENLKSTTATRAKESVPTPDEPSKFEEKEKVDKVSKTISKVKSKPEKRESPVKEHKKETKSQADIFDIEKEIEKVDSPEILAYVPQRQAAKKAAEHIKSGLGSKPAAAVESTAADNDKVKKDQDTSKSNSKGNNKKEVAEPEKPAKVPEQKRKSSSNSSSSSSSSSSTDSSTSSSSESDDEPEKASTTTTKTVQQPRSESPFSSLSRETTKRSNVKDWPFLDKGSKPAASSSSSDSSDSSRASSPKRKSSPSPTPPQPQPARVQETTKPGSAKSPDKKSLPVKREEPKKSQQQPAKREEQPRGRGRGRPPRGRGTRTSDAGDRLGNADVGLGNLSDGQRVDVEREHQRVPSRKGKLDKPEKESTESSKLLSPVRKTDKKLKSNAAVTIPEKEMSDKKGSKDRKSSMDRLFSTDRKTDKFDLQSKPSPEKHSKLDKQADKSIKTPETDKNKSLDKERNKSLEKERTKSVERERNKSPEKVKNDVEKTLPLEKPIKPIEKSNTETEKVSSPKKSSPIKKSPVKSKCIDDIFANKVHSMDSKENKVTTNQINKSSEDIYILNKIIEDDLKQQNSKEIQKCTVDYQKQSYKEKEDINKLPDLVLQNHLNLDFDIDSFGDKDEDIIKGFLPFPVNIPVIKGDTKEDSARETLNLVEKLRMGLSKKSSSDVEELLPSEMEKEQEGPESLPQKLSDKQPPVMHLPNKPDSNQIVPQISEKRYDNTSDYPYLGSSVSSDKNIPLQQTSQSLTEHTIPIQGDERWVPPSEYPNIQSATNYLNDTLPQIEQQFNLHAYQPNEHHKPQQALGVLPAHLDVRLQEESLKSQQSPSLHDRRVTQTPLIDPTSMDCMPSPSPYGDIHPQAKWADSAVIPNRRSSSSSAASTSSLCKGDQEEDQKSRTDLLINHPPQMDLNNVHPYLENFPAYSENSQQFVSPVSLFPPPNINNAQIPFPPTGPTMYPPQLGAPFPTPHPMPPLPKPVEENLPPYSSTCTAAFTSSEHNMALTAAMVNLPTTTAMSRPDVPVTVAVPQSEPIVALQPLPPTLEVASPAQSTPTSNATLPSPSSSLKSNSSIGKKSPSKPTRTSARVTSQVNKSPSKSPGKSPRQEAVFKQSSGRGNKRGSAARQNRGRGRGRGRGRPSYHDHEGSSIHQKLVGTVYDFDFDDDASNDNMTDLKSMRERRKSSDHDRKFESPFAARHSPISPLQSSNKNRSVNADLRDLRPPTPIEDPKPNAVAAPMLVTPVLPGPVDMRTYNSDFDRQQAYNDNLLGAFANDATEVPAHEEIDEEFEKELHSALTAKKPDPPQPSVKVSLSDTRNQLKFKIKGPFANNYTSHHFTPQPPIVEPAVSHVTSNSISNNVNISAPTNLPRMRKKELLQRYCNQDMNNDDPSSYSHISTILPNPTLNRTIITIPKAVASMTSIPTKEDYRDYYQEEDLKHHRKESKSRTGLSRELKQLDVKNQFSFDDDPSSERRRSIGSVGLSASFDSALTNKRRGRPPRQQQQQQQQQVTPKLKIKIGGGNNSIVDDKKDRIRPPKKRHSATVVTPSVEDIIRENSMKFRKRVMADLKCDKIKKKKKDRSEKKKKKKAKGEMQIISNQAVNPTKLIIRIGKKSNEGAGGSGGESEKRTSVSNETGGVGADTKENKNADKVQSVERSLPKEEPVSGGSSSTAPSLKTSKSSEPSASGNAGISDAKDKPLPKVTPLKLKLSRCLEGSGYVMKPATSQSGAERTVEPGQPPPPSKPPPVSDAVKQHPAPAPLPLNKDCEVR